MSMEVTVYLDGQLIATLAYRARDGRWLLVGRELHVADGDSVRGAIATAARDVTTDVFQPSGRRVQINAVEYVARPMEMEYN